MTGCAQSPTLHAMYGHGNGMGMRAADGGTMAARDVAGRSGRSVGAERPRLGAYNQLPEMWSLFPRQP
jgi:hypothetical protein